MHVSTYMYSFIRGASFKVKDINNYTPIMRAIASGHQPVVKMFLEFGCKVDSVVRHQKTLLEWAIENEYNVLIEVSISYFPVHGYISAMVKPCYVIYLCMSISKKTSIPDVSLGLGHAA